MRANPAKGLRGATALLLAAGLAGAALAACGSERDEASPAGSAGATMEEYRAYLRENAAELVTALVELEAPIRAGNVPRSESLYVIVRVALGQLEPITAGLEFRGLRKVEQRLWADATTEGLEKEVRRLRAEAELLRRRLRTLPLRPDRVARGAAALLREVADRKLQGREQPYADADLADVSANLEGAEAAFSAVAPLLSSDLRRQIQQEFGRSFSAIEGYGAPARESSDYRPAAAGAAFVAYGELSEAELRDLAEPISALAESLSSVEASLA